LVTAAPDKLTYGIKQATHGQVLYISTKDVLNAKVIEKVTITLALHGDSVPQNSLSQSEVATGRDGQITHNLRMTDQPFCHYLGCSELSSAHEDVDVGSIFCQVLTEI
jgi:hypothetical protein